MSANTPFDVARPDGLPVYLERDSSHMNDPTALQGTCGGGLVAISPALAPCPLATLDFLKPLRYPSYALALSDDRLNLPNGGGDDDDDAGYQEDAGRVYSAFPADRDRVYGRRITTPDGTSFLTYWIYYYYNDGQVSGNIGDHEGDWEYIQIRLASDGSPAMATSAQHSYQKKCGWDDVTRINSHVLVYPGLGTHASYFRPGQHEHDVVLADNNDDDGAIVAPTVDVLSTASPIWSLWPGRWGASNPSPQGPIKHPQYRDPQQFEDEADLDCGDPAGVIDSRRRSTAPNDLQAPQVTSVRRDGATLVVRYRLHQGEPPERLLVAAVDPNRKSPAATKAVLRPRRAGSVKIMGLSSPAMTAVASSSFDAEGRRSRTRITTTTP